MDLSFLNSIPNFVVMAPKDFEELEKMLEFSINLNKPTAIRYPRGEEGKLKFNKCEEIALGKAEVIKGGKDISIIAIGKMVERALEVSDLLETRGIDAEIINARFLKPFDKETLIKTAEKTKKIVTMEDGTLKGGLASTVIETINNSGLKDIEIKTFGYDDIFVEHGKVEELEKKYGLDAESIAKKI